MKLFLSILFAVLAMSAAADIRTELYQPSHKPAAELIATVAPVYQNNATLASDGQQIIIRSKPSLVNEIVELLLQLDHPARQFVVEVTSSPEQANSKTFSTKNRSISQSTFTLNENIPLTMIKERQNQQLDSIGPLWASIKTVPSQKEFLQLKLQSAKDYVYVDIKWQSLINGRLQLVDHRLQGYFDEWLPVSGSHSGSGNSKGKWSTKPRDNLAEALYIKISPID